MYLYINTFLIISKEEGIILSFSSVAIFFLILLISGMRKTARLKEENRKLMETINLNLKETDEHSYQDFTESHSYGNDA